MTMAIDEAIAHSLEKGQGSDECAANHRQLAEWLKLLVELTTPPDVGYALTLKQAIDDATLKAEKFRADGDRFEAWTRCSETLRQEYDELQNQVKNGILRGKVTQEILSHFYCGYCGGWWTISNPSDSKSYWCPHCGIKQAF